MTALESAIKKGYDPTKYDKMLGVQFLLTTMIENYCNECQDYQVQFGLGNDLRNQVRSVVKSSKSLVYLVNPIIGQEGCKALFEDFEELRDMIDKFLNAQ